MIRKIILVLMIVGPIPTMHAQSISDLERIIVGIKEKDFGSISTICADLDNDGDNDYLFTYSCGESNCFEVFLTINGKLESVLKEFGSISYDYETSVDFKPSHLILKSDFNHCCGESPFDSYRRFIFKNDKIKIVENYVRYDYENYCFDERLWDYSFLPMKFLVSSYRVKTTKEKNNIRFSADIEEHIADFVCIENTNIIGQLKINSEVEVLAEYKGHDKDLRTWLYVEVDKSDLDFEICNTPLTYDFENQKLRGWISDKYTIN